MENGTARFFVKILRQTDTGPPYPAYPSGLYRAQQASTTFICDLFPLLSVAAGSFTAKSKAPSPGLRVLGPLPTLRGMCVLIPQPSLRVAGPKLAQPTRSYVDAEAAQAPPTTSSC